VSSKSNDYAEKTEREQRPHKLRLMFMCKVSLGQVHVTSEKHLTEDAVTELIEQRGQGGKYHTIIGDGQEDGGPLNYQETVVYANEAAIPSYLIVYDVNPVPGFSDEPRAKRAKAAGGSSSSYA